MELKLKDTVSVSDSPFCQHKFRDDTPQSDWCKVYLGQIASFWVHLTMYSIMGIIIFELLIHWRWYEPVAILQTIFSNAFYWIWLFKWQFIEICSLVSNLQKASIGLHGTKQVTSHCLNEWQSSIQHLFIHKCIRVMGCQCCNDSM